VGGEASEGEMILVYENQDEWCEWRRVEELIAFKDEDMETENEIWDLSVRTQAQCDWIAGVGR
jgi:hypothetical protein